MTTFVEECRQEWRRLGVPDILADEMAEDLAADLAEAQSEGVAASEILGESDPRRFAATWALERGLLTEDSRKRSRRAIWLLSVACVSVILAAVVALLLALTSTGTADAMHRRVFQMPGNNIACEVIRLHPGEHAFKAKGQALFCEVDSELVSNGPRSRWVWAVAETGEARVGPSRVVPAPVIRTIAVNLGDPLPRTTADTLVYGRDWSLGRFTCESRSTGLTCRNSSQHGFTLSRKSQQTF